MRNPSIFHNTLYLLIAGNLAKGVNFFQVIILVRYLGRAEYGMWSLAQSLPSMLFVLTDMGITSVMLRRIARDKEKQPEYVGQVIVMKIFLSIIYMAGIGLFLWVSSYGPQVKFLVGLSSLAYLFSSYSQVVVSVFRSHEKFGFEAVLESAKSIIFLLFVGAVVLFNLGLYGLVIALLTLDIALSLFCMLWYRRKFSGVRFKGGMSEYLRFVGESIPFAFLAFVYPIFFQIDVVMLSRLSTFESVAIYNAPYKIILVLLVLPMAVNRVLFPRLSMQFSVSLEQYRESVNRVCRIIAMIAVPLAVGLFLLADKVIVALFSEEYSASALPLKIMTAFLLIYYLRTVLSVALYSANMEKYAVGVLGAATVINGILDLFLIPKWDYMGAAVASLISEALILLFYYGYIRYRLFSFRYLRTGLKIAASTAVMGAVVVWSAPLSFIVQIIIASVVYAVSVYYLKILKSEEYMFLRQLVRI